jgi:steroid delta-isomerase-like uncharacterized protein
MRITLTGISMSRFAEGKLAEGWNSYDGLGMMQQIGVIPPMGREDFTWGVLSAVTGDPGDPDANKAIIGRLAELWNTGNLAIADEIFGADFVNHDPNHPEVTNLESYKGLVAAIRTAFPDFHVTTEDLIAEGDKVAVRWIITATHQGELAGIPATDIEATWTGMTIWRFADGKLVEGWWTNDMLGLLIQLGVIPPPG